MKLGVAIISVFVYCVVVTILMYVNTVYLNLGDPKLGADGWTSYWFIWAASFSPIFLFGVVLNWIVNGLIKDYAKCNFVLIILLSIFVEISFIVDISWPFLIIEYAMIGVIWINVLKLKMFLTKRFA